MLSAAYIVAFVTLLGAIVYCPKIKGQINGVKMLIVGVVGILCIQAFAAGVLGLFHIRVSLLSVCAVLLCLSALLWVLIRKKGRQEVFWRVSDGLCVLLFVVIVWVTAIRCYAIDFRLQDMNGDTAWYFSEAMKIVQTGTLGDQYFAPLFAALGIELFSPVFPALSYYKAYFIAELVLHALELGMLYVLILTVSEKKLVRICAPLLGIAYFWGYPAYNYMAGGFLPWSCGVIIFMLMLYVALLLEKRNISARYGAALLVAVAVTGLSCDRWFFRGMESVAGNEIYSSMYADLIFFLPAFFYVCYYVFGRKKSLKMPSIASVGVFLCTVGLYIAWYNGAVSIGGYYKMYYYLWLLGWVLAAQTLEIADGMRELPEIASYAGMIGVFVLLTVFDVDGALQEVLAANGNYATRNFFALYRYNRELFLRDYADRRFTDQGLEAYEYVLLQGNTAVILTEDGSRKKWFDVVTENDSSHIDLLELELPDVLRRLTEDRVDLAFVWRNCDIYAEYGEYFTNASTVFENEDAVVYTAPDGDWMDVSGTRQGQDAARLELYTYVKEHLPGEEVPLLAARESYLDFVLYEGITGNVSTDFYTWKYDAANGIVNLVSHNTEYVVLLADDAYYLENREYFERHGQIIFENGAGWLMRCADDAWSLTY